MNSDDNEPATHPTPFRSAMNHQGRSTFSNPFAKTIRDSQTSSPGPIGRPSEGIPRKERPAYEDSFQTPQRKTRPFQTPIRDKGSVLAPYINFLRGSGMNPTAVYQSQLRPHEVQQPTTPPQLSSSPVPVQEQWTEAEAVSVAPSQERTPCLGNNMSEENAFEELKGAHKTVAEQNKLIETLRYQVITLKNARNTITREHTQTSQELEAIRKKMGESSARISSLQSQLERSDVALNAKSRELKEVGDAVKVKEEEVSQLVERLEHVSKEVEEVRNAYVQEITKGEGLSVKVVDANRRIQELVRGYGTLEKNLQELGDSYNAYRRSTDETLKEAVGLKNHTATAFERITNHSDIQKLLGEAKTALADLKDELSESHRVNDLLRDKLHITTAQLAEATNRARELEAEKREVWECTLRSIPENEQLREALAMTEKRANESATKLLGLQEHSIVLLAQLAELEAKMIQAEKRNGELSSELVVLRPLQQEKLRLQTEVADFTRRLSEETITRTKLQDRVAEAKDALITAEKEAFMLRTQMQDAVNSKTEIALELSNLKIAFKGLETTSRASEKELQAQYDALLSGLQETINKSNQDAAVLRAKYEFLESQHDQLRTSMSQEQAAAARLQQELKEIGIRELIATGKVEMHEARIVSLTKEINTKDELLRQLNAKFVSAQDRYEVQASTLRLTKEELGDMYEKLGNANKNSSAAEVAFRTEIAVLQEQKSTISTELDKTRQDMKTQEDVSSKRVTELQGVIQGLQKEVQRLNDVRTEYENTMRREAANWKDLEEEYKLSVNELQEMVDEFKVRRDEEAKLSIASEKSVVFELEAQAKALREEKEEMLERQRTFQERYRARALSDIEKDIVASLLQDAKDLHEQAAVEKDNEIKRRDATISALQARTEELESSLVQAYHPAEVVADPSTILNLKISPNPLAPTGSTFKQPESQVMPDAPQRTGSVMVPIQGDLMQDVDNLIPLPSQLPSELSTPPQSPLKSKSALISFVRLSREDSETENDPPPMSTEKSSVKRMGENDPVPGAVPFKKRLRTNAVKKVYQEGKGVSEPIGRVRQKRKKAAT